MPRWIAVAAAQHPLTVRGILTPVPGAINRLDSADWEP